MRLGCRRVRTRIVSDQGEFSGGISNVEQADRLPKVAEGRCWRSYACPDCRTREAVLDVHD